jgi:hypothetical protein
MNYSTMFDWVMDAMENGMELLVPDEWHGIFVQVCKEFKVDYKEAVHDGYRIITSMNKES